MLGEGILSLCSAFHDQHSLRGINSLPQEGIHHTQIVVKDPKTDHEHPLKKER